MSTPFYPESLPIPKEYRFNPTNQVLASEPDSGPIAYRRRSRQPGAIADVEFRYLVDEYQIYVQWFKVDLLFGHKWFWIPLPGPNGIQYQLARFMSRPTSTLEGHTFWTVTGQLEIRDRFSTGPVFPTLTSLIYPLEVIEHLATYTGGASGSIYDAVGHIDVLTDLVSGTLESTIVYKTITADPEAIDVASDIIAGAITVTIAYKSITADPELLDVTSDLVSGTIEVVIVYVTHEDPADDEELDVTTDLLSGTLT